MSETVTDLYTRAAGIDIHQAIAVVSAIIPSGYGTQSKFVRAEFDTFTEKGLKALVAFLLPLCVEIVLMESTGVYWMSAYDALQAADINVAIVNPREVKGMRGRKTDKNDADWLAKVAKHGCFTPSYVPDREHRALRSLSRYTTRMREMLASEKNRLGKLFNAAGYRLNTVFTDMYGAGGMHCVRGILDCRDPHVLLDELPKKAKYKHTREEMLLALGGRFEEADLDTSKRVLKHIDYLIGELSDCVAELQRIVKESDGRKFELLQTIPGVDALAACIFLAEVGGGALEDFDSAEALCSWAGLAPSQNESGGKKRPAKARKGNKALRRVSCECAAAAVRTKKTTLKNKFQSLMQKGKGYKKSIMAIARKIMTYAYYVLKNDAPYIDPQIDYQKEHATKNFRRFIGQLRHCMHEYEIIVVDKKTGEAI